MAEMENKLFPYINLLQNKEDSSSSSNPVNAVIFFGLCLIIGIACRHFLRGTRIPYTVALLFLGIATGSLEYGTSHRLGKIGDGIRIWRNIDPDLLLAVFLPPLLFESSFSMETHQIKRCMVQMLLLAGPGVLISTFCIGSALKLSFPFGWSWKTSLLLGGLLSATDPVAVVALLKELGASKKLSTIIEGESMMNDGIAVVVYQLFLRMVLGWSFNWGGMVKFLVQASLGAVGIGLLFGIASVLWLGFIFDDILIEMALTLAASYIAYFTAQEWADSSGILTVMTLGIFYAAVAGRPRTAFKGDGHKNLHHFWEMVAYIANTVTFILSGVIIAGGALSSDDVYKSHVSWGYLILLYVYVQLSRMVAVGVLFPVLRYFGYGLDWKEATIISWSGLRGVVALSLSLSVERASGSSIYLSSDTGTLFVFFTAGVVFLTLVVNGSTTQLLLHHLQMDKLSATKRHILNYTKYDMLNKAMEAFSVFGDDEEQGPADWPIVRRHIASLNMMEVDNEHPRSAPETYNDLNLLNLSDIRIRLLNGVQAAYGGMFDEGRITLSTANILMQSVDEAIDLVAHTPLSDWKGLKDNVHIPNYYKFLHAIFRSQKLVTYIIVERLESACSICAAFLRAHKIARHRLHDFIGDSELANVVINESEAEGEEARKFLEDVRETLPQVLRDVKTRQVTNYVLKKLIDYVQNLEEVGSLEANEMLYLLDAVQTDTKKLWRNPSLVKMPKRGDLISSHPLLGALPCTVRDSLADSTKETMMVHGSTLYKELSKPKGVWLISNGVVKWASEITTNTHLRHPTFTPGSTLGLYEVLSGIPYICNMVTDSVVLSFFIDSDKILLAMRSDPAVEDFLWQESVTVLAKLLLPHIFENMAIQELRALLFERSLMKTYIRDEIIELQPHSVGFLLEGFIKSQGVREELFTSPAALLPSHWNQSINGLEPSSARSSSLSLEASMYLVETRARVIILDMATLEAGSALNLEEPGRPANSLLDREIQLTIFGSMDGH